MRRRGGKRETLVMRDHRNGQLQSFASLSRTLCNSLSSSPGRNSQLFLKIIAHSRIYISEYSIPLRTPAVGSESPGEPGPKRETPAEAARRQRIAFQL